MDLKVIQRSACAYLLTTGDLMNNTKMPMFAGTLNRNRTVKYMQDIT